MEESSFWTIGFDIRIPHYTYEVPRMTWSIESQLLKVNLSQPRFCFSQFRNRCKKLSAFCFESMSNSVLIRLLWFSIETRFSIVDRLSAVKKYWLYRKTCSYNGSLMTNEKIFLYTLKEDIPSFLHGLRHCNKKKRGWAPLRLYGKLRDRATTMRKVQALWQSLVRPNCLA